MDPPGYADADEVKRKHGNRVDAHGPRVGAGGDDGGDEKDRENRIADVRPKKFGADDAEHGEEENEDGHFKADAEAKDDGEKETGVVLDGDHRREVMAEVHDQDFERAGQHIVIA